MRFGYKPNKVCRGMKTHKAAHTTVRYSFLQHLHTEARFALTFLIPMALLERTGDLVTTYHWPFDPTYSLIVYLTQVAPEVGRAIPSSYEKLLSPMRLQVAMQKHKFQY